MKCIISFVHIHVSLKKISRKSMKRKKMRVLLSFLVIEAYHNYDVVILLQSAGKDKTNQIDGIR